MKEWEQDKGEVTIDLSACAPVTVEQQIAAAVEEAFKGKKIEGKFVDVKLSKAFDTNEARRTIRDLIVAGGGKIAGVEVV